MGVESSVLRGSSDQGGGEIVLLLNQSRLKNEE
jgi:hypothetical protein